MTLWFLLSNYGLNLFSCTFFGWKENGSVLILLWSTMWLGSYRSLPESWLLPKYSGWKRFDQDSSSYPIWKKIPIFGSLFHVHLHLKLSLVYPALSLGNCCCSSPWASWLGQICSIISYSFCTLKHSSWKDKTQMYFVYIHTNTSWWFAIRVKSQLISSFPDAVNWGLLHHIYVSRAYRLCQLLFKCRFWDISFKRKIWKRNIQLVYVFFMHMVSQEIWKKQVSF